jgi:hypothetical protein
MEVVEGLSPIHASATSFLILENNSRDRSHSTQFSAAQMIRHFDFKHATLFPESSHKHGASSQFSDVCIMLAYVHIIATNEGANGMIAKFYRQEAGARA